MAELNNNKNNVQEKNQVTKDDTEKGGVPPKEKASEPTQAIKDQTVDITEKVLDKTSEVKAKALDWIKDNPGKSLGIAFLVGWFFSKK